MLKDVLEDVLEELKESNRSLTDARTRLSALEEKVGGFEQKLTDQQVIVHPPDLDPVIRLIGEQGKRSEIQTEAQVSVIRTETEAGLRRLAAAVETQPKPIVRRICFFPENDYSGSYKHFITCLFWGIMGALLICGLYSLGSQYLDRQPYPAPMVMPADTISKANAPPHPASKKSRPPKLR